MLRPRLLTGARLPRQPFVACSNARRLDISAQSPPGPLPSRTEDIKHHLTLHRENAVPHAVIEIGPHHVSTTWRSGKKTQRHCLPHADLWAIVRTIHAWPGDQPLTPPAL